MSPLISRNLPRTQGWLLFAALILLIGTIVWGLKVAAATLTKCSETAAWPVVTGTIIESRVVDRGGVDRYCPLVRYAYDLGASVFHASRIALLPGDPSTCSRTEEAAAHLVATYPVDRRVPVHYDPIEPGRSVLEVRAPTLLQAFPQSGYIALFVLVVVGIRQLVLVWSKRV
jgi:hypothetical protein